MDRRRFLLTSVVGTLAAPLTAGGQQARKVPRVAFLTWGPCPGHDSVFGMALRELGYT
jgi:hypothetical protein